LFPPVSGIVSLTGSDLINVFITGGLFHLLKAGSGKFTSESFFMASAKNFWPFGIFQFFTIVFPYNVIIVPVSVPSRNSARKDVLRTLVISFNIFPGYVPDITRC
jgi:hypothetical protein